MKSHFLFLILILFFSCKDKTISSDIEVCGVKDPIRNLPWLRTMIEDAKAKKQEDILTITMGKIKDEVVFDFSLIYMSCIGCNAYHCDGSRVDPSKYTHEEMMDFMNTIRGDGQRGPVLWPQK
nr:hypothetical protein [uncultured Dyadobacter sp.]